MMKSRRRALKSLSQEKVVDIADYRQLRVGKTSRRLAIVTNDTAIIEGLKAQIQDAEVFAFDSRFSLEQALKSGEWDGVVLDQRDLGEDAVLICEKLKRQSKTEDLFVFILSNTETKELVREGFEKGCDEWITCIDPTHLARLIGHHLH